MEYFQVVESKNEYSYPDILNTKEISNFYIYNILGEKVYYKKLLPKGELNLNFKKLKLKPGIYFLKIDSEKFKKIEKIIYLQR